MSHRVVAARPEWQHKLLRLGLVLLALLLAWAGFEYGRVKGGYDVIEAAENEKLLQQQIAAQEQNTIKLREQIAILERSNQIEQKAYQELQETVNGQQDEILELKEELAFYRGIVSPDDATKGLKLQSFELTAGRGERKYRYQMVLTQVLSTGNLAYGNIALSVEGVQDGEDKRLTLAQLSQEGGELKFRFKYFQSFEGELFLPEGFVPSKVHLDIQPRSRHHKQLTEAIDWMVQES